MKLLRYTIALLVCLALGSVPAQAQISVSLPDLTAINGTTVDIPIRIDEEVDPTQQQINAYDVIVEYDSDLIQITKDDLRDAGTLSEGWIISASNPSINELSIAAVTNSGPIDGGPGTLLILEAEVQSGAAGSSPIAFQSLEFNEGTISSITTDGNTSVGNDVVITEIHADPAPGSNGDANGDGTRDGNDDEFVEIVNTAGSAIDISGYTISEPGGASFTFPSGTSLSPGTAATVFGGGTPTGIPGLVFTDPNLGLNNDGDTVTLSDGAGNPIDAVTYGSEGGDDQSVTRSPSAIDPFVKHLSTPNGLRYSPGQSPDGDPLPVELTAFKAVTDGGDVTLRWRTATETNNSGFEVQQRTDQGFTQVGFVEGAGTTTQLQSYQFTLDDLEAGTHVFRLKQVDFDGAFEYSRQVEVTLALSESFELGSAYPNPFHSDASFTLQVRETQDVRVVVYNALGQRVQEVFSGTVQANTPRTITIDGAALPSGMYMYRAEGRTFTATRQIMRVK